MTARRLPAPPEREPIDPAIVRLIDALAKAQAKDDHAADGAPAAGAPVTAHQA